MSTRPDVPPLSGVRRAAKRVLFNAGHYRRRLAELEFPGAAILCYHSVRADGEGAVPFNELHVAQRTFEQHCQLIAECCNPISLTDMRDARSGVRPLPARPVLVTFDDGYRGVLDLALPILQRYQIPAVVFSCSGPITRGMHFWFDAVCRASNECAVLEARTAAPTNWTALVNAHATATAPDEHHRPMTVAELKRLAASSLIEIGGHTLSHPTLALMPLVQQQEEIGGCRSALENILGTTVNAFAYPYGRSPLDYSPETVAVVRHAGFTLAFTTQQAFARTNCNPYEIPRFVMLDSIDNVELAHRLTYAWHT